LTSTRTNPESESRIARRISGIGPEVYAYAGQPTPLLQHLHSEETP
jgi:hypothetical protein